MIPYFTIWFFRKVGAPSWCCSCSCTAGSWFRRPWIFWTIRWAQVRAKCRIKSKVSRWWKSCISFNCVVVNVYLRLFTKFILIVNLNRRKCFIIRLFLTCCNDRNKFTGNLRQWVHDPFICIQFEFSFGSPLRRCQVFINEERYIWCKRKRNVKRELLPPFGNIYLSSTLFLH